MKEDPFKYVADGALFLDKNRPGWYKEIDKDRLNIRHADGCILGQLYGSYYKASDNLKLFFVGSRVILGFTVPTDLWYSGHENQYIRDLHDAWIIEINRRLYP